MSLPFRRRSRTRGAARLALTGDFPATDQDITEALPRADWDGQTYEWRDASGATTPADVTPIAIKQAGQDTEPLARLRAQPRYTPATVLPMPQARAVMKVYPPGPGVPAPTPQALEVARFLRAKVLVLKRRGHADRISDEKLKLVPGDRATNRRTTAMLIVDEAAELLRCGGEQR